MNDIVGIGRFGSPYGIKGWIKVISYTDPIEQILSYLPWHIVKNGQNVVLTKVNGKQHGKNMIVKLPSCSDRNEAMTYTNIEIFIERSQLPKLEEGYYWVDLIGLSVVNQQGVSLGTVESIFATGSNDVLVVAGEGGGKQHYIPYTDHAVINVDLTKKQIEVDWDPDF